MDLLAIGTDTKVALGVTAVVIGLASYVPYLQNIINGRARPHAFSWLVWGLLTVVSFAGQVVKGAGAGSRVTGVTAILCFVIFGFSLARGEKSITRGDCVSLSFALLAIPLWVVTNEPLLAIILVTVIDAVGFYPTVRKSWTKPWEETALTYFGSSVKFFLAILALEQYSVTTVLYPLYLVVSNLMFVALVLWRRQIEPVSSRVA
ncbi:MAG: hypothetical protein IT290_10225 [Deltaproteobacteria bacterium]|nr:hypothetical protein [Deltaproteobacteria bacterium]